MKRSEMIEFIRKEMFQMFGADEVYGFSDDGDQAAPGARFDHYRQHCPVAIEDPVEVDLQERLPLRRVFLPEGLTSETDRCGASVPCVVDQHVDRAER